MIKNYDPEAIIFGQWNYLFSYFKSLKNWEEVKKYFEYAYIKSYVNITEKIISNLEIDSFEIARIKSRVEKKVFEEFPNLLENQMIQNDKTILKSSFIKKIKK